MPGARRPVGAHFAEEVPSTSPRGVVRQSRTTKGCLRAAARLVDALGEELLARTGLPLEDDRDVVGREPLAQRQDVHHARAARGHPPERCRPARLRRLRRRSRAPRSAVEPTRSATPGGEVGGHDARRRRGNVPLVEPRSVTRTPSSVSSIEAWRRETVGSVETQLAERCPSRPGPSPPRRRATRCAGVAPFDDDHLEVRRREEGRASSWRRVSPSPGGSRGGMADILPRAGQ